MKTKMIALCLTLLAVGMWAQSPTSAYANIPLKNWDAPLHWLPPSAQEALRKQVEASALDAAGATQPLQLVAITPCRVMDTRAGAGFPGAFGPPSLQGNAPRTIPIPGSSCGIPSSAAYSLNFTLVCTYGPVGFLSAWPDNVPFPGTSVTNALAGGVVANAAVVPAGPDGGIDVMVSTQGDLVIDINGYYVPGGSAGGSNATTVNGASVPAGATFTGTNGNSQFTALTATQATAAIAGASGGGTINFLRADGTWAVPLSGGGSNVVTLAPGSASAPSLSFLGEAGTGIYSSGAGFLNFTNGGTNTMTLTSSGDLDLPGSIRKNGILFLHNVGNSNTGVGANALAHVSTAFETGLNTAVGAGALYSNTIGSLNSVVGQEALLSNTTGSNNTASGNSALSSNTTGNNNTAIGLAALQLNTTGDFNIAFGYSAGGNLTTGSNNIMIGNRGVATDDHIIRIGDVQTKTFLAGVTGVTTAGAAVNVVIDSNGQLGTVRLFAALQRRYPGHGRCQPRIAAPAAGYVPLQSAICRRLQAHRLRTDC